VALVKSINWTNHPPEDTKPGDSPSQGFNRWSRIAANQMETLPLALMVLWGSFNATNGGMFASFLFFAYTAARIFFVYAYLTANPLRGMGFFAGHLCVILGTLSALIMGSEGSGIPMVSSLALYILNLVGLLKSIDPCNHPEEDQLASKPDLFVNTQRKDMDTFHRWARVCVNQQEQLPMAMLVLWGARCTGADVSIPFVSYVVLRLVYMASYVMGSNLRGVGFLGGQLSIVAAMVLGGLSAPMLVTSLLYLINMIALAKTADPNNQPKENPFMTEEKKAEHKAKMKAMGFNRELRVCINQLEQFPMGLVTLWAVFQVTGGSSFTLGAFAMYLLARVAYAVFYLQAVGPARQLAFGVSLLSVISSAVVAIVF